MHTSKRICHILTALILATMLLPPASASAAVEPVSIQSKETAALASPAVPQSTETAKARALEAYGQLPLSFIPNQGQVDRRVGYYVQSGGQSLWFTADGVTMALPETTLRLEFLGANPLARLEGGDKLPGIVNYFIGNDPAKWRTNIPTHGRITYRDLWPGVDLTYEGRPGALKSTFTLAPGSDPAQIRLAYPNADSLVIDGQGNLIVKAAGKEMRESAPLAWQEIDGRRVSVAVAYQVARQSYGFFLPEGYDPAYPLVIDPELVYSTFLGGSDTDSEGYAKSNLAVDGAGNAYVTGYTPSSDFPTTPGAFDTSYNHYGTSDAFVVKVNAAGTGLAYGTFLGGFSFESGHAIAVDGAGNAYVTGSTGSYDFPTTPGAFDTSHDYGNWDAFVVKLNAAGTGLAYGTFLGGDDDDDSYGIAVDGAGNAYVTGYTRSSDFPTTPGAFDTSCGTDGNCSGYSHAFVVKMNAAGTGLAYGTFLGGSNSDHGYAIAVDGAGNAYVTGSTSSYDFPTTPGAFDRSCGTDGNCSDYSDAFVVKMNTDGTGLAYGTFLGGSGDDQGFAIAVDGVGNAYVTGSTYSYDFPTTPGAFDRSYNGGDLGDAFVAKVNAAGTGLAYGTFLGGRSSDWGRAIAVDGAGNAYVTGYTSSYDFPTTPGAFDTSCGTDGGCNAWYSDAFVIKLNATGTGLAYGTFLGGSDNDWGEAIAVDGAGSAYVAGDTSSSDFPTTAGAFDTSYNGGGSDVFVAKLAMGGTTYSISGRITDGSSNPTSGVVVSDRAGRSTTTATNGYYSLLVTPGVYTLTPSKEGHTFQPDRRTVTVINSSVTGQDFTDVGGIDDSRPTPFLHLPFDREDTWEYYNTVLQNWDNNGLLNSWMDHMYPNSTNNWNVVMHNGDALTENGYRVGSLFCYENHCYDGHDGLDFRVKNDQGHLFITDIRSVANGVVAQKAVLCHSGCVYPQCSNCGPLGNHVFVYHSVDQGNGYFTLYAHLAPGTVTGKSVGESVSVGEVLGTVGNTGNTGGGTGTHLHFGVYRDNNDLGHWDGSAVDKAVDPFGWRPVNNADHIEDPWVIDQGMNGRVSHYLWVYEVREGVPNASGDQGLSYTSSSLPLTLAADPGAFLGQALFELSSEPPEAVPSAHLRSVFHPWWLRLLEWVFGGSSSSSSMIGAQDASEFALSKPITFTLTYPSANTRHLDTSQIVLYRWDQDQAAWQPLPTQVDAQNNVATASTYELGNFHLQAPLICPADESEIDDTFYSAKGIGTDGTPASRLFDISGDADWFWFSATQGITYTLQTSNLAAGVDTVMELYDTSGVTLLASNDDSGGGQASKLEWTAPLAGVYFLRVAQASGSTYGCDAVYELSVSQEGGPPVYLPIILKNR